MGVLGVFGVCCKTCIRITVFSLTFFLGWSLFVNIISHSLYFHSFFLNILTSLQIFSLLYVICLLFLALLICHYFTFSSLSMSMNHVSWVEIDHWSVMSELSWDRPLISQLSWVEIDHWSVSWVSWVDWSVMSELRPLISQLSELSWMSWVEIDHWSVSWVSWVDWSVMNELSWDRPLISQLSELSWDRPLISQLSWVEIDHWSVSWVETDHRSDSWVETDHW